MGQLSDSPLGSATAYPETYSPDVLYPVERQRQRDALGLTGCPWQGMDRWLAFEVSWLTPSGLPVFALATIDVPAQSPYLVESKSLKLYLNSFNMSQWPSAGAVQECIEADLSRVTGERVRCQLATPGEWSPQMPQVIRTGLCLDNLEIVAPVYDVAPERLEHAQGDRVVTERLYSHLLRSNCPVTGQPDWGTLVVEYQGRALSHEALLAYLVSYRHHTGFHEHCVEQIFSDLHSLGGFRELNVWALYARRGGLAINPWRSLNSSTVPDGVLPWQ